MVNDSSTKFPSMDAARNTRSTVKKLSSREQRIQTSPVKVDIEKGSLRIATETSNLETFPLPASILEFACIHSFSSLLFLFPFSRPEEKKSSPLFRLYQATRTDSISSGAVFARKKNFRRWTRGGGRGSLCEKLSVRSLLPKGTLFFFSFFFFLLALFL